MTTRHIASGRTKCLVGHLEFELPGTVHLTIIVHVHKEREALFSNNFVIQEISDWAGYLAYVIK